MKTENPIGSDCRIKRAACGNFLLSQNFGRCRYQIRYVVPLLIDANRCRHLSIRRHGNFCWFHGLCFYPQLTFSLWIIVQNRTFAAQYFIATDSGLFFVTWSAIQFQFTLPQMWQHFAHWIIDSRSSGWMEWKKATQQHSTYNINIHDDYDQNPGQRDWEANSIPLFIVPPKGVKSWHKMILA